MGGVVDGLSSITNDANLPKDQWTALGDVAVIRDGITAAGPADDAEVDGTWKATTNVVEKLGNVAKKNGETAGGGEEEKPTPGTPEPEPEAPNTDVAAIQEAKHLSRKR